MVPQGTCYSAQLMYAKEIENVHMNNPTSLRDWSQGREHAKCSTPEPKLQPRTYFLKRNLLSDGNELISHFFRAHI